MNSLKRYFFIPHIGSKYKAGLCNGKKVMVLGASFYCPITEYRAILAEFGYNIAHEVWLGTKDFTGYEGEESTIVSNIIMEIETIKKRM